MYGLPWSHLGTLALSLLFAGTSFAQGAFPNRHVTLTVPVGVGGGTDLVARQLGKSLSALWGQPVVVDNKAGASGMIGAIAVAKSAPDGYNLLVAYEGPLVATPVLFKRPDYDPQKQLTALSQVTTQAYAVVVHPSVPATNMAELIALIKKKNASKEPFGFATSAVGAADHLSGETFRMRAGVELLNVHYKGTALAIADVVGGHVPFGMFSFTGALPHIKSGALRVLAITSDKRSDLLPGVPTIGETIPGYQYTSWIGVLGPAGMSQELRERISQDIHKAVASPEMTTVLVNNGLQPTVSDPAAFTEYIRVEAARTADLIKRAQIKVVE